jgi:hypothetical protein
VYYEAFDALCGITEDTPVILWVAGTVVTVIGLLLTYMRWRGSGARVVLDCDLVGPADKPYSPPHHPAHYRVQLSNTGRTTISVVEVAVLSPGVGWAFAKPDRSYLQT